jgi:protein-L-isoaspartate(D-aspartate) O-methyltransferase
MEHHMDEAALAIVRRAYAKQVLAAAGIADARVEDAFAAVRREDFLGAGPWPIFRWLRDYVTTPTADPVYLYTDDLVGIVPDKRLNNGQPSLHALLIARAGIREGDHVVHVGAGVGYYTAIMAHLAGATGRVTAIELEPELAARAQANFTAAANVRVVAGDGTAAAFDRADVIYVNAGATRPAGTWLDGLADGGRLILPLTTDQGFAANEPAAMARRGAIFRITRQGDAFHARWISRVAIFRCESARDVASEAALAAAFAKGGWERVTRLYRGDDVPAERCWLRAPGWCLAYE